MHPDTPRAHLLFGRFWLFRLLGLGHRFACSAEIIGNALRGRADLHEVAVPRTRYLDFWLDSAIDQALAETGA